MIELCINVFCSSVDQIFLYVMFQARRLGGGGGGRGGGGGGGVPWVPGNPPACHGLVPATLIHQD